MDHNYLYVVVSSSSWDKSNVKYRRHRLVEYLNDQDNTNDILWVYPASASLRKPSSYLKAIKVISNNFSENTQGIKQWALPDCLPGRIMQFKSGYSHPQFKKLINYINNYEAKKVLWYAYPAFPYLAGMLKWDQVVYDCSDLWTKPSGGKRSNTFSARFAEGLIDRAENMIISKSNILFASSSFLAERIENSCGRQVMLIENGVDLSFFEDTGQGQINSFDNIPKPRLGYVGALRSKLDFNLLNRLADKSPASSIVLVGPDCLNRKEEFKALLDKSNVYWLGPVSPECLPEYIRCLDVGLLPYQEIEYNKAVFPVKFYEYLAQGIPVVGCGLPSTANYAEEGVYLHVEREKFFDACLSALSWADQNNAEYTDKCIKIARSARWDMKFKKMLATVRKD